MQVILDTDRATLVQGDSLEVLKQLGANTADALVTDPPAGISFMGKAWDDDKGGRKQWIAWLASVMREAHRVLKPGAHALVWALPRTSHWTATALEEAGFEIRDRVSHLFGTGFPKSLDVSKAIDARGGNAHLAREVGAALKAARETRGMSQAQADERFCGGTTLWSWYEGRPRGIRMPTEADFARIAAEWSEVAPLAAKIAAAEREVVGKSPWTNSANHFVPIEDHTQRVRLDVTAPSTEQAQQWDGWGTALKPACEDWWLVRKPLEGTVAANVLAHGVGGLNVDGCRIAVDPADDIHAKNPNTKGGFGHAGAQVYGSSAGAPAYDPSAGRWPANVTLGHSPDCENIRAALEAQANRLAEDGEPALCTHLLALAESACAPDCAVRALDEQSGTLKSGSGQKNTRRSAGSTYGAPGKANGREFTGDAGGASRFFYTAKVSRAERDFGCEGLPVKSGADMTGREEGSDGLKNPRAGAGRGGGARNFHPTVKPQSLMRWLVRLITPPGGVVLDPFAGSGSTGVAALHEGCRFLGVELGAEYTPITKARLERALADTGTTARAA